MRVSCRCTRAGPCRDRCDLLLGQRIVIGKMPVSWIGEPRRHHLHFDRMCHGIGPRSSLFVGDQRHRRNFTRTMAALAVLLKNGQHILIKSGGRCSSRSAPRLLVRLSRTVPRGGCQRNRSDREAKCEYLHERKNSSELISTPLFYDSCLHRALCFLVSHKAPWANHSTFPPKMLNSEVYVCP